MVELGHHEFAIHTFAFVALVCVCLFADFTIKRKQWFLLPESAASMIIGFLLGCFILAGSSDGNEADFVKFDITLFFFILLPPIILEAGYTLDRKSFFSNIGSILVYAVVGTILSTIVVGYGLYGAATNDVVPLNSNNALEALMFGSLISAVDPVATLTLMGSPLIGAPQLLYSLVFGEAVLNDAVAIVLYRTFESFLDVEFSNITVFYAFTKFIFISIGSVIIGVIVSLACAFLFKKATLLPNLPHMEVSLILLFAYSSYFFAELCGLSGIMSLFFCAIGLAHYNYFNLDHKTQHTTHLFMKSLAQICDTFVFAYLGLTIGVSLDDYHGYLLIWDMKFISLTIVLCLVGRAVNIFPLTYILNRIRVIPIAFPMQITMWFAGLRGAIAFALALQVTTPHATEIVTCTLAVVLFTTFVLGGLTEPLLRFLHLKNSIEVPAPIGTDGLPIDAPRGFARLWLIIDNTYLKVWFGGDIDNDYCLTPVELRNVQNILHVDEHHDNHGSHSSQKKEVNKIVAEAQQVSDLL